MAPAPPRRGCERAGPPLLPLDHRLAPRIGGIRDGPIDRSDPPARRRASDMTSYDGRSRPKTSSAPDCTCSPSRNEDHYGRDSLHDHFATRHRPCRNSAILTPRNTANAGGAIRKSSPSRTRELPVRMYVHSVICHGAEQKLLQAADPRRTTCNFLPFHTDPVWQWHGGSAHAPAR
jgi:hypothetical protein